MILLYLKLITSYLKFKFTDMPDLLKHLIKK